MSKAKSLIKKIPDYARFFIRHWNSPPEGKYLSFREWAIYCLGGTGAVGASVIPQYIGLTAGMYVAAALHINVDHIVYVGLITSLVTIFTSPLVSYCIDNTNSKYGKFRPYLIWLPIPLVLCYFVLGQVLPMISNYTLMLTVYTILYNMINFLNRIYSLAFSSISQVISPDINERTNIMSIGTFFTSLGPTLVTMIYPALANYLYSEGQITGVNTIGAIKWLVPIMAIAFFALGLLSAFGNKERMVLPKEFKQRQKFSEGVRKTLQNKYFWIVNTSAVLGNFKMIGSTFSTWIILYMIFPALIAQGKENAANLMQTIVITIIGDACVPGMLFAPWIIKKFGKKKIIIFTTLASTLFTVPMIFFTANPILLLVMIYLITLFNGIQVVTGPAVNAQIYDYQQYKTGDRLEGFLSQFGAMITTACGMGFSFVAPAVYKHFGYIDDTAVLYTGDTLQNIISWMCIIGVVSGILAVIPYFFYDLSEERHSQIMDVLKIRANYQNGLCSEAIAKELEARVESGEKMLMCHKVTQENLIGGHLLFRIYS